MRLLFYGFFIGMTCFLFACGERITSEPVVAFHNDNVLLPKITFETSELDSVFVEFWSESKAHEVRRSKVSIGTNHSIILMNLIQDHAYTYKIKSLLTGNETDNYQFNTGRIPQKLVRVKKHRIDTTLFDGYILLRRFFRKGVDIIMNREGEIVWYHEYDTSVRRAFSFTDHKSILSVKDTSVIMEINLYGETLNKVDFGSTGTPQFVHHEVLLDSSDNIIAIQTDSIDYDGHGSFIQGSGIIRARFDGTILWEWNILNHIDVKAAVEKSDFKGVVGHANSIAIDKDNNYLVSFRDLSQIWKVNSSTGEVMWRLGKNGDFKMDPESYFVKQHSIHFNKFGDLMMFDNGDFKIRPGSRVVALRIDEKNKTINATKIIELPRKLTSYRMCSAYLIDADKYLVCTTRKDANIAVLYGSEIVWEVTIDNASYRAYYLENPFEIN